MLNQFTFENPWFLLIFFLFVFCQFFCKEKLDAIFFPNMHKIENLAKNSFYMEKILKNLIASLMIISLASPVIKDEVKLQKGTGYEISLIVDASGSMAENSKFSIVKDIVSDFLDKRVNDRISLSLFADFAYVAVPLTYDKKSIKSLLKRLSIGVVGSRRTALNEALFLSSNIFKKSKAKRKIVILLTDGKNNVDNIPLEVAIKMVQKYGIKVYTIGIGNSGDFDAVVLRNIARKSGGKFFSANSKEKLFKVYSTIDRLEKSEIETDKYVKKRYLFVYILSVAIMLLLLLFFRKNRIFI